MNRESFSFLQQHRRYISFCASYLLGLIAGALYIARYPPSSLMRLLVYPQMSIVTGFIVSALPFVVCYIILRYSAFGLILPLAFFKAFTFMYCFGGISIAYTDAGWLVRFLLLFTDCFSMPLLIWYVGSNLFAMKKPRRGEIWFCFLYIFIVRCIDSYVISPFALELLSL